MKNDLATIIDDIKRAANCDARVAGLTHQHYKYPARFSPTFVAAVIEAFSTPGDLILDPYMGGGTTIVEAMAANRRAVGCDLNSLAVFVTKAKITKLTSKDIAAIRYWALQTVPELTYRVNAEKIEAVICPTRTRNMHLPRSRAIKKFLALAIHSCEKLPTRQADLFARCALLNVSQWALNGRKIAPSLSALRAQLTRKSIEMLDASVDFIAHIRSGGFKYEAPYLINSSSEHLVSKRPFNKGELVDLVITSPPYPGVHILYHRWQVDGRKETPAPYWIANCSDGEGGAYYNFGDRKQATQERYFDASLRTLRGIRAVMRPGAKFVQMLAFSDRHRHLPQYLSNMVSAGFRELRPSADQHRRIWRRVPGRSWHAELQGETSSSREVVLLHEAV